MRKYIFVLALLLVVIFIGCANRNIPPDNEDAPARVQVIEIPAESYVDEEITDEARKDIPTDSTSKEMTLTPDSESQHTPSESPIASESNQPQKPATTTEPSNSSTQPIEHPSHVEDAPESSATEIPSELNATATDADTIANLVVAYINDYRIAQGTPAAIQLSGLTEYAKYRSRQIISDFSHNTYDERAAATALSYGMYVDPALYGMTGEPYYTACAGEAIAKAGYAGTVDYIAKSLADLVRNSSKHWVYVGDADYKYIAVGITYESGMWYCDIALTRDNYG